MSIRRFLPVIAAVVAVTAVLSLAQQQYYGDQSSAGQGTMSAQGRQSTTPSMRATESRVERLDKLRKLNVTNWRNEKIGEISDFVIDKRQGKVAYAVLAYSGKRFAVPWQSLSLSPDNTNWILDIPRSRLDQDQGFTDQWPAQADVTLTSRQGAMQGSQDNTPYQSSEQWQSGTKQDRSPRGKLGSANTLAAQHPWLERATELIGQDVVNTQNQTLGDVFDITVDMREGRVVYAVLAHGGALGVGQKLTAVPWSAMQFRPDRNELVLDAGKDKIDNAPSFTKNEWPDMTNVTWAQDVHNYFGTRPYWQVYGYQMYLGQQHQQPQNKGWESGSSYNQQFNEKSMQTIEGRITNVSTFTPEIGAGELGYRIKVQTDDGNSYHVHIGPKTMVDQQIKLENGQRIRVSGSLVKMNGRAVLMACELEADGRMIKLRQNTGEPCWGTPAAKSPEAAQTQPGSTDANMPRDTNSPQK